MSKELKISNVLDKHLSPIEIDGVSVPIELSTGAVRFNEDVTYQKDLIIEGDLSVLGKTTTIKFSDDVTLDSSQTAGYVSLTGLGFSLYASAYSGGDGDDDNNDALITLHSSTNYDSALRLYSGVLLKWSIGNDGDDSNILKFDVGTTVGGATKLALDSSGNLTALGDVIAGDDVAVPATGKISLDGIGGDTYIYEASADVVRYVVGDDILMSMTESGADGNQTYFVNSSVGFTQLEPTYDATTTVVDFRHSNKQFVTFGAGNIANISMYFPLMSGNFVLLLKQDGTGSRTVTNYKVFEFDESSADGSSATKFAGGSNPTLTTDANHVDILSFYWDADNEIAYGVATLDFQF